MSEFDDQLDNNLSVYAWDNNTPKLRTDTEHCANCNHQLDCENNSKCSSCGHVVKLFGYNNVDFNNTRDNGSKPYNYQPKPVKTIAKIEKEQKKENFELSGNNLGKALGAYLSASLCLTMLAFMIAVFRDELTHRNGSINFSLVLCILLFPQMYITFAIVDFATRPKC